MNRFPYGPKQEVLHIREFLSLSNLGPEQVKAFYLSQSIEVNIVVASPSDSSILDPCRIGHMYWFHKLISELNRDGQEVVICCCNDPEVLTLCAVLTGSLLILLDGEPAKLVEERFSPIASRLLTFRDPWSEESLHPTDCWRALARVRALGWVDFSLHPSARDEGEALDSRIDLREHLHYDCPANGGIHVLVPGRLIAFDCPHDSDSFCHVPAKSDGSGAAVPLTVDYYAEVRHWRNIIENIAHRCSFSRELTRGPPPAQGLRDFGVRLAVSLGGGGGPAAGFVRAGLAAETLECGGSTPQPLSLLQALPRHPDGARKHRWGRPHTLRRGGAGLERSVPCPRRAAGWRCFRAGHRTECVLRRL